MLARLLSLRQVVLLCDNIDIYLFYRGKVYHTEKFTSGILPTKRPGIEYCPIWGLIDVDSENQAPPASITSGVDIWPIQTSSPKPDRWHTWIKYTQGAVLGMSLWNVRELMSGYVFNLFIYSAIDPGHVARWRFITG